MWHLHLRHQKYHFDLSRPLQPEAEQNGDADSWNDSSDDEGGGANAKEGGAHKKAAANEGKLIAVLRSQVLTLTRENDELREKLQVCAIMC